MERELRCGSTSSRRHLSPFRLRSSSSSQPLFAMNLAAEDWSMESKDEASWSFPSELSARNGES
ncbi:hypothetical protein HID58_065279 [Brassica napus]|uniref:Uncharacterized protein n=1 Tax=Brassica napus TaxID=3708 RepID=A0ABQ7ZCS5_BRANA|nr:hypothetical protein HID58_065279 [Brassica napus]